MNRVIIVDKYGVEMCELKRNAYGFYDVQSEEELHDLMTSLDVGDEYRVTTVWTEED